MRSLRRQRLETTAGSGSDDQTEEAWEQLIANRASRSGHNAYHLVNDAGGICVVHREYVQDITTASVGTFMGDMAQLSVNPALPATFPATWQLAKLYEQWRPRKLAFEFRSLVTPGNETSTGSVTVAWIESPNVPFYENNRDMANCQFSVNRIVTEDSFLEIDCLPSHSPIASTGLFTRTDQLPNGLSSGSFDKGRIQVAAVGCQPDTTIGQLWAYYIIDLEKFSTAMPSLMVGEGISLAQSTPPASQSNGGTNAADASTLIGYLFGWNGRFASPNGTDASVYTTTMIQNNVRDTRFPLGSWSTGPVVGPSGTNPWALTSLFVAQSPQLYGSVAPQTVLGPGPVAPPSRGPLTFPSVWTTYNRILGYSQSQNLVATYSTDRNVNFSGIWDYNPSATFEFRAVPGGIYEFAAGYTMWYNGVPNLPAEMAQFTNPNYCGQIACTVLGTGITATAGVDGSGYISAAIDNDVSDLLNNSAGQSLQVSFTARFATSTNYAANAKVVFKVMVSTFPTIAVPAPDPVNVLSATSLGYRFIRVQ
jgi:hypothetical protein